MLARAVFEGFLPHSTHPTRKRVAPKKKKGTEGREKYSVVGTDSHWLGLKDRRFNIHTSERNYLKKKDWNQCTLDNTIATVSAAAASSMNGTSGASDSEFEILDSDIDNVISEIRALQEGKWVYIGAGCLYVSWVSFQLFVPNCGSLSHFVFFK